MKIHELRNRVSSLARNQMSAEQHNHHLQTLVNALDQLESGQSQEVSRLRRQFRWLCATTVTLALSLCLTYCFLYRQSQWQLAQSQAQLARHQEQLSQQQEKLTLYESALLRILKTMTTGQSTNRTGQR